MSHPSPVSPRPPSNGAARPRGSAAFGLLLGFLSAAACSHAACNLPNAQVFTLAHSLAGTLTARVANEAVHATPSGVAKKPSPKLASLSHVSASQSRGGHAHTASPAQTKRAAATASTRPASSPSKALPIDAGFAVSDPEDIVESVSADGYTGLIIDARGLDLDRSMSPAIRRRDGTVVWNGGEANPDYVISEGIVSYAMTLQQARDQKRAGSRPLVIKAVARHETPFPSDPYIDDSAAENLLNAAKHDGFLKRFRVIFVIGRAAP